MKMLRGVAVISLAAITSILASNPPSYVQHFNFTSKASFTYTVSSIEIQPETTFDINVTQTVEINIKRCEDAVPDDYLKENHVLVYPEYAITSNKVFDDRDLARNLSQELPWPGQLINPCSTYAADDTHIMVKRMSCLAIQHNVYIVTHFIEREDCNECSPDNYKLYSTAVAFDRRGFVVAKYRKLHMYGETALDSAPSVEIATFTSDFDVKFGIVMSFDLMFVSPATLLTDVLNVTEILVPFAFRGVLPFLTPLQMQFGWSFATNVNLIPGCYLKPSEGYSGCGTFFGDHNGYAAGVTFEDNFIYSSSTIDVNSLNRTSNESPTMTLNIRSLEYDRENTTDFISVTLEKSLERQEISACHNSFCCQLTYLMLEYPEEEINYKLLVFDGMKWHSNRRGWHSQMCGLVACSSGIEGNDACTDMPVFESYTNFTVFSELVLSGTFNSSYVFPSSMLSNLFPFNDIELIKEEEGGGSSPKFNIQLFVPKSVRNFKNIQTFALHSHDLEAYYSPIVSSSFVINSNLFVILLSLYILLI